jgi:lipopolysaccharide transport system ATP-binding protein
MSDLAIQCRGLSKRYRRGDRAPYHRFSELLTGIVTLPWQWARSILSRPQTAADTSESQGWFWAVKDVDLDVQRGEVLGIIGRNGAGKSTLLKLLSRITEPTRGEADLFGRVGSLLEVGTGFHPELTGRENIFLYGAILGMSRPEIRRKFDEMVAFAEVEKFLDTPVKRYSSGMYTRLAFAVAAHLEPEILIVDEVLAVGDAEFQKKCLGKMGEVAQQGRTVLFVSHNMGSIVGLCSRAVVLNAGQVEFNGGAADAVRFYMDVHAEQSNAKFERAHLRPDKDVLLTAELTNSKGEPTTLFNYGDEIRLRVKTNPKLDGTTFGMHIRVKNARHELLGYLSSWIANKGQQAIFHGGETLEITIPSFRAVQDTYYLDLIANIHQVRHVDNWWDTIRFSVVHAQPGHSPFSVQGAEQLGGLVLHDASFERAG